MKIEKLIDVFEKLLPIYERAYKEEWSYIQLMKNYLDWGICLASYKILKSNDVSNLTDTICRGYYKNFVDENGNLFDFPRSYKDLLIRIDFMKSEIKSLKRLQKKGFTHV